ncbi:tol-pal system YbgF family protein [Acidobacteriota bacterium]
MKCPSCAVIFPDHIKSCPRCKVAMVADDAPVDPELHAAFKKKLALAREQAKQKGALKKTKGKAPKKKAKKTKAAPAEAVAEPPMAAAAPKTPKMPAEKARAKSADPVRPEAVSQPPSEVLPERPKKSSSRTLGIAAAIVVVLILVIWFLSTGDSRAYNSAEKVNTIDAFQAYIERYPEGKYKTDARSNMASLRLIEIQKAPSHEQFEAFIEEYSDTGQAAEARKDWERALMTAAREKDDLALYRKFLSTFPSSDDADEAGIREEELSRIAEFFNDPEFVTRRVEPAAVNESLQIWADANLHKGDTLYAFARDGEELGSCTDQDIANTSSSYQKIKSVMDHVDYYSIRFPSFDVDGAGKLKLGVDFSDFKSWIKETDDESLKSHLVEQIKRAIPEENFEILYPAPNEDSELWGKVVISYKDSRYAPTTKVPREFGGRAERSSVTLRINLKTAETVKHTWTRLLVRERSPSQFPDEADGDNADIILRDEAVKHLGAKIPRLSPK